MLDLLSQVATLKRPKLLVRAARFGIDDYQRDRHLRRVLKSESICHSGPALLRLMEIEREHNDLRVADDGSYLISEHVNVLVAIMGEAQLLRAMTANVTPIT
ncbi:DUF6477 family protein [Yoonia sp. 208BN28-4]|uniref:DUF6477 family protein n=1 Tax=Yoonia sp. 208BN28-4 TaxID=3126505 RepID=UPI0030A0C7B4